MHQHIFKVGWLLTHDRKTTVIFYYTAFLPGVLLHELCRWLTAGILNVRASQSVQLPQHDDIGQLRLRLVQISPDAQPLKKVIIEGAPLIVALAALWLIATVILDLESSLRIASGGNVADLGQAVRTVFSQPDFWLWFYLAFTIANTMLPPVSKQPRNRKLAASTLILIGALAIGLASHLESIQAFGSDLQRLLSSISLILSTTTIINVVMVLSLGMIEAVIERLTGHSATFHDGKMNTLTRQQAQTERDNRQPDRSPRRKATEASKPDKPIRSIYALPLPIPGAPGKEPVSKPVAAVLNISRKTEPETRAAPRIKSTPVVFDELVDESSMSGSQSKGTPHSTTRTAADIQRGATPAERAGPIAANPETESAAGDSADELDHDAAAHAPFSRPFAESHDKGEDPQEGRDAKSTELGFARPFAPAQDLQIDIESEDSDSADSFSTFKEDVAETKPKTARPGPMPKTRPVPKPSQHSGPETDTEDINGDSDELRYESLDDVDIYDDGEDFDDDPS